MSIYIFIILFILTGCASDKPDTQTRQKVARQVQVPESPKSPVEFVDVTEEAGVAFQHDQGTKLTLLPEVMGSGAAFADYDNDGDLDLYVVNGSGPMNGLAPKSIPTNVLFSNNGDGTFTDVTQTANVGDKGWGMGCVFGDYDNDGDLDLYVTNFGPNVLYRNSGDGTFTNVTKIAGVGDDRWGTSAAFGDYDNDGYLDIYVANYVNFDDQITPIDAEMTKYTRGSALIPQTYDSQANVLYRNNGDGTFMDVTKKAGVSDEGGKGLSVVFGDYDNDGDLDLYVVNDVTENKFYRNNGDSTFLDISYLVGVDDLKGGMGAVFGDYDNDGDLDMFSTYWQDDFNALYKNTLDNRKVGKDYIGNFVDVTIATGLGETSLGYVGWGTDFWDYDNDADLDILVVNGYTNPYMGNPKTCIGQRNLLFRSNGDGTFTNVTKISGEGLNKRNASRGAVFGDYDNDGDIDVYITNNNGGCVLLRNDGGNKNNWLHVKTVGTNNNHDGIGARVKVVCGSTSQIREVCAGSSYLCQNSLEVEFGLGNQTKIDLLEIRWPSGIVQKMENVDVNQKIIVVEGD